MSEYSSPPWNFSWIIPNELAALGWPQTSSNIFFLYEQGIRHLVTLSPEKRPPIRDKLFQEKFTWTEIAIEEFEAPTVQQILEFIEACKKARDMKEAIGVHCRMGRGRTGTMLACYFVYFLEQPPERAIINIRLMRPGSVETREQERVVIKFHDYLRGLKE